MPPKRKAPAPSTPPVPPRTLHVANTHTDGTDPKRSRTATPAEAVDSSDDYSEESGGEEVESYHSTTPRTPNLLELRTDRP